MLTIEELIDVSGTADWRRRKAEEYPEDERNSKAAELLKKLAGEIPRLEASPTAIRIKDRWGASNRFSEIVSEELRSVGFQTWPDSGQELLEQIASRLGV